MAAIPKAVANRRFHAMVHLIPSRDIDAGHRYTDGGSGKTIQRGIIRAMPGRRCGLPGFRTESRLYSRVPPPGGRPGPRSMSDASEPAGDTPCFMSSRSNAPPEPAVAAFALAFL